MILAALIFGLRLAVILVTGVILTFLLNSFIDAVVDIRVKHEKWKTLPQVFALNLASDLIHLFYPVVNLVATKPMGPGMSLTSRVCVMRRDKISWEARKEHARHMGSAAAQALREIEAEIAQKEEAPSND